VVEWGCGLVHVCMCFGIGMSHEQDSSMTTEVRGCGGLGMWECGGVSMCVHVCMCFGMDMSHDQDPSMTTSVLGCRNVGMWGCPCVFIHVCASVWV